MTTKTVPFSLFERNIVKQAVVDSFKKLSPRQQMKNPVMFVVWVGSVLTTALFFQALFGHGEAPSGFILAITLWLWFTVLFANFAEALAEGRSRAQAAAMRSAKRDIMAKKLTRPTLWRQVRSGSPVPGCARTMWCWWKRATSFPATAR